MKKSVSFPLMVISLYSPNGTYDQDFLSNYATININDALLRVKGVGDIQHFGASNYAMRVWVNPDKLQTLGLTVTDVQNADPAAEHREPGRPGRRGARAAGAAAHVHGPRAGPPRRRPRSSATSSCARTPTARPCGCKDVARIELGTQNYKQVARFNGKPAAVIAVFQIPGSNALDVADGAKKTMDELKKRFPADMAYAVSLDTTLPGQGRHPRDLETLLEAFVLVVLVVFLFLQSWRATLIPLLTVPVSLIGAFAFFPLLGFSINTLSLFGLVLAIGLVVDDAIVVVEAVEHHIEEGMTARDATRKAMEEVTGPVVAIALILSAVFIPVAFMAGITGRLYQQFALTIAVSVLISAFKALTLSPALCALLLKPRRADARDCWRASSAGFNRGFDRRAEGYVSRHAPARAKARPSRSASLVVIVAATRLARRQAADGLRAGRGPGLPLHRRAAARRRVAAAHRGRVQGDRAILAKTPGVAHYNAIAGFSLLSQSASTYSALFFVSLKPWDERKTTETSAAGIAARLNKRFHGIPRRRVFAFGPPAIPGISAAGGFS